MQRDLGNLSGVAEAERLIPWRALILQVAAEHPAVGEIAESLKWGEPSYTPVKRNVSSSVRLGLRAEGRMALLFVCHTGLVEQFRGLYQRELIFEGQRAILVGPGVKLAGLQHCVAMALTYFLRQKSPG